MSEHLPKKLKFAALASLATSLSLGTLPLVSPEVVIAPLVFANWCLFALVSYLTLLPLPRPGSFSAANMAKLKVWAIVLIAFTVAGWIALGKVDKVI